MSQKIEGLRAERKYILDFIAVNKPYGYAYISDNALTHEVMYETMEPTLTDD